MLRAGRVGPGAAPSGQTVGFTCAAHAPAWAGRICGRYLVLERAEWEARGAGYRGVELGG